MSHILADPEKVKEDINYIQDAMDMTDGVIGVYDFR